MQISLSVYGDIICKELHCPFVDSCANHITADSLIEAIREEDIYFSPELVLDIDFDGDKEIFCKTKSENIVYEEDEIAKPANIEKLGYGEIYLDKNNNFCKIPPARKPYDYAKYDDDDYGCYY